MFYSDFDFHDIKEKLQLQIREKVSIFPRFEPVKASSFLKETLQENIPLALAIDTGKARAEMMISPILIELRKLFDNEISLFSGIEFNVDTQQGLQGNCDFLLSHAPEQLEFSTPILMIVEAKHETIKSKIPQCIALMLAAQKFNNLKNNRVPCIYGIVTTGSLWKILKLENKVVEIELREHFVENIESLLGILAQMIQITKPVMPVYFFSAVELEETK